MFQSLISTGVLQEGLVTIKPKAIPVLLRTSITVLKLYSPRSSSWTKRRQYIIPHRTRVLTIHHTSPTHNVMDVEVEGDPADLFCGEMEKVVKPEIRIWMDGAFDMMHFGHMNAFRQGKALGTTLIVGVNNDASITACKGKPVTSEGERMETVRGCRWVDEIVADVPYIMNEEYLSEIIIKHRIDYVVHGDDPCLVDGKDVYETAQKLGKYLTIPRTEGISTTAIVGRILNHLTVATERKEMAVTKISSSPSSSSSRRDAEALSSLYHGKSNFRTTGRMMKLFAASVEAPVPGARVVYIGGNWDLLHAGHLSVLEKARLQGDYLIVGVYNDTLASVLRSRGIGDDSGSNSADERMDHPPQERSHSHSSFDSTFPILSMEERVLSILGCKYVSDVLIDAPYVLSSDLLMSLNISIVITVSSDGATTASHTHMDSNGSEGGGDDPYKIPRERNILRTVTPSLDITAEDIMDRILRQEEKFKKKFAVKKAQEDEYYAVRYDKVNDKMK